MTDQQVVIFKKEIREDEIWVHRMDHSLLNSMTPDVHLNKLQLNSLDTIYHMISHISSISLVSLIHYSQINSFPISVRH